LDELLLPGTLEFVAAVRDAAGPPSEAGAADRWRPLLPALLDADARDAYRQWRAAFGGRAGITLRDFFLLAARSYWARSFLAPPSALSRVEELVQGAGGESVERFVSRPLYEAWRIEVGSLPGIGPASPRAPVVTLATPGSLGATLVDTWVYLCLGSEPPAQHYRVLSRATDRLLILYQEVSPLPGEEGDEPD
jgi:hypothetical protein